MAHPMNHARAHHVEKGRVSRLTKGYASGGAVHKDAAQDKKLFRKMFSKEVHAEGEKSKHRMDRPKKKRAEGGGVKYPASDAAKGLGDAYAIKPWYGPEAQSARAAAGKDFVASTKRAHGGKVGKKHGNAKTVVNVITGGDKAAPPPMPMGPPPGVGPAAMPPPMAAKPPMAPPPGAGPGGPPPGMPMRARGGKIQTPAGSGVAPNTKDAERNKGSKVFNQSLKNGTQISGTGNNKDDGRDIGRGRVVTFWAGGKVKKRADGGLVDRNGRSLGEGDQSSAPVEARQRSENWPPPRAAVEDMVNRGRVRASFGTKERAKGGRVESPQGVASATRLPGGSGGGEARLAKEHRAERKG